MAFANMIPEIWSARFLANLDKVLVYGLVVNRDYQPDAEYGNLIHTHKMGPVTIGDYTVYTTIGDPEQLSATEVDILIDQQKFFNFHIDNVEEAQTRPNLMNEAMGRSAYAMGDTVDQFIASLYSEATTSIGAVGSPVTPVDSDIYSYLTEASKTLDEANVPTSDRFLIMNPAGIKLLKDSGEMLSDTPAGDIVRKFGQFDGGTLPEGYKGRVAGFDIWMSNNTPSEATPTASTSIWLAGHPMGISFVDSLNKIEGYSPEQFFSDAIKGLYVYGAKTTQPDAIVPIYTTL